MEAFHSETKFPFPYHIKLDVETRKKSMSQKTKQTNKQSN